MNTRHIYRDLKSRLRNCVLRFSQGTAGFQKVEAEMLSRSCTPHIKGRPWFLYLVVYSFSQQPELDETSRLYRINLDHDKDKSLAGFPADAKVAFYLILNADRIPAWSNYQQHSVYQGESAPADGWCDAIEEFFQGLAHEILYYADHCCLDGLDIPNVQNFINPFAPNNARDHNLICSIQSVAKQFKQFEHNTQNLRIETLESFTTWQQRYSDDTNPFLLSWRTKWVCKDRVMNCVQTLFAEFPILPRKHGHIDLDAVIEREATLSFGC